VSYYYYYYDTVSNMPEQAWLTRYPWPTQMIFDRGSKFKAELSQMIKNDYGIQSKIITSQNPRAKIKSNDKE
jgi:hypothetical protein